ncbi:MAG: rhomboid family intramembrane serine protease [Bacteroidetes bacterium]|nr:rhomboid family intramembrane serine protease [Bacteroidota bacterium]
MFSNMPNVVKNLLIINLLFFLATIVMERNGVFLISELGLFYPDSPNFKPYQLVTHFFMHGGIAHIFFNMFSLVMLGSHLERLWGPKRFLLFYFITALGAAFLHMLVQGIELYQLSGSFFPLKNEVSVQSIDAFRIMMIDSIPTVGASGAIYGLIMAFALLFPNTEFMLLFPPIPIKAKWLALLLGLYALYSGYQNAQGDSVAHFAHLGGMLFGFILIKIWQRDKTRFY